MPVSPPAYSPSVPTIAPSAAEYRLIRHLPDAFIADPRFSAWLADLRQRLYARTGHVVASNDAVAGDPPPSFPRRDTVQFIACLYGLGTGHPWYACMILRGQFAQQIDRFNVEYQEPGP